jgi:hypothetical protein
MFYASRGTYFIRSSGVRLLQMVVLFVVTVFLLAHTSRAQEPEKEGAGAVLSKEASAKDIGLPFYPGSKAHKDKDESNDSAAVRMGLWGGGSGFKLAVAKRETDDSPEKVAAFYKKALAKYGKVLDCSNPSPQPDTKKDDSSHALTCGDDKPDKGGMLFKAGTKEVQHIAAIQPHGSGSLFQLVALAAWDSESHQ